MSWERIRSNPHTCHLDDDEAVLYQIAKFIEIHPDLKHVSKLDASKIQSVLKHASKLPQSFLTIKADPFDSGWAVDKSDFIYYWKRVDKFISSKGLHRITDNPTSNKRTPKTSTVLSLENTLSSLSLSPSVRLPSTSVTASRTPSIPGSFAEPQPVESQSIPTNMASQEQDNRAQRIFNMLNELSRKFDKQTQQTQRQFETQDAAIQDLRQAIEVNQARR
ncbi:hypothetical protein VUR80DRAFT_1449 [Thermomyces stellatus]